MKSNMGHWVKTISRHTLLSFSCFRNH